MHIFLNVGKPVGIQATTFANDGLSLGVFLIGRVAKI